MKKKQALYMVLILVLLVVFCTSAVYVISYFAEGRKQQTQFDELANLVADIQNQNRSTTPTVPPADFVSGEGFIPEPTEPAEPAELVMLPEYAALYERNPHVVGWLKIDGTAINYPVMQTPDSPDYYLKRNFNHEYSARGCLYVREQCDVNAPSDNLTIYGHNMRDGSMFHDLNKYVAESYWKDNNLITFDTLYEHHTYQIFAVFTTSASVDKGFAYHLFVDAEEEAEFQEFVTACKELALYDTGITPEFGDKFICLSTCEYSQTNGRLVVVAVRVD